MLKSKKLYVSVDSAMTLLVASLMDLERDTYMNIVTSFTAVKDVLNKKMSNYMIYLTLKTISTLPKIKATTVPTQPFVLVLNQQK